MRWPWHRHKPTGGAQARQEAEQGLTEAISRWPEVLHRSESLRELRQRNHFAELVEYAMRGQHR